MQYLGIGWHNSRIRFQVPQSYFQLLVNIKTLEGDIIPLRILTLMDAPSRKVLATR